MPSSTLAKVKRLKKLRDEKRARRLARKSRPTELPKPQPKQQQLIDSTADIVIFGGSAGGGKSAALLLDFAKPELLSIPGYSAVIFRRTYPQIRNEGGLWDESNKFYPLIQGEPLESRLEWRFPNNQTIRFAHLQHEKNVYDWQGSQLARIGFDELVHFSETQFWYLLGRARTTLPITPQVRATCNPDADSWVAKLIDWWIGEDGLPIHERSGVLRWFVRVNGVMRWADEPEQLIDKYPNAHPKSLTFIPSLIHDNQALLKADPGYLANLEAQHPIERARLLDGNWKVKFDQGKIFNRAWFEIVDELPTMARVVRFWDLAATAKAVAKNTSYYTAGVKIGLGSDGNLYVLDVVYQQKAASEVIPWIAAIAQQDGKGCPVRWELEGGSSGKIVEQYLRQALSGFNAIAVKPMGDKLARALPPASDFQKKKMRLSRGVWNDVYMNSLNSFDGSPQPLVNDLTDATSGAHNELTRSKAVTGQFVW